jgi:hypothetical protein
MILDLKINASYETAFQLKNENGFRKWLVYSGRRSQSFESNCQLVVLNIASSRKFCLNANFKGYILLGKLQREMRSSFPVILILLLF